MRFVFNFIFYGLLFYVIWVYFPDAFNTLVTWVTKIFTFLQEIIVKGVEWIQGAFATKA